MPLTPIDVLIQHLVKKDIKLWEALKSLSDHLLKVGVIKEEQIDPTFVATLSEFILKVNSLQVNLPDFVDGDYISWLVTGPQIKPVITLNFNPTPDLSFGTGAIIGGVISTSLGTGNKSFYGSTSAAPPGLLTKAGILPYAAFAGKVHVNLEAIESAGALSHIGLDKNGMYGSIGTPEGFNTFDLLAAGAYGDLISYLRYVAGDDLRLHTLKIGTVTSSYSSWSAELLGYNNEGILGATLNAVTVSAGATTYIPIYGHSTTTQESSKFVIPLACTISRLWIKTSTNQPGTGALTVTIEKNGVATAVTKVIPLSSVAGIYADLVNSVAFSVGDTINFLLSNAAGTTSAAIDCIMFQYIPTSGSGRIIGGTHPGSIARNAGNISYSMPFSRFADQDTIRAETTKRSIFPRAGTISNLWTYVDIGTPGNAASTMELQLMVNGVNSFPTLTFVAPVGPVGGAKGAGVDGVTVTGTRNVVAGDVFDMRFEVLIATPGIFTSWSAVIE